MPSKLGRPFSEDPRNLKVETRMTKAELEKLDICCKASGKSRSEVIRMGIDYVYNFLYNQEKK